MGLSMLFELAIFLLFSAIIFCILTLVFSSLVFYVIAVILTIASIIVVNIDLDRHR